MSSEASDAGTSDPEWDFDTAYAQLMRNRREKEHAIASGSRATSPANSDRDDYSDYSDRFAGHRPSKEQRRQATRMAAILRPLAVRCLKKLNNVANILQSMGVSTPDVNRASVLRVIVERAIHVLPNGPQGIELNVGGHEAEAYKTV
jgi:hypothetical protein